jgi:hypothetical protein
MSGGERQRGEIFIGILVLLLPMPMLAFERNHFIMLFFGTDNTKRL